MTWSGSWSRWRPAQPERRGQRDRRGDRLDSPSACDRFHASPQAQARFALQGMLGAKGATRQGVSAPPPSFGSDRTTQTRASELPQRNRRLSRGSAIDFSKLPRFGMSTKPASAARIRDWLRLRKSRSVRRWLALAIGRMQLSGRIHQQAPGDSERWVLLPSRGVNSYEVSPRSLFARRRSSALRASWGSAPDFAGLPARRRRWTATQEALALLQHEMERRFDRNAVRRRESSQRRPKAPS